MPVVRDRYCSSCGTAFPEPLRYPRRCPNNTCGFEVWANPVPVAVVLVPVRHARGTGLLVVRRSIEPRRGLLVLVGGFVEEDESWQQAGVREVWEESGVRVDPGGLTPLWFVSSEPRPNRVLLFSVAPSLAAEELPDFAPTNESDERGLVFGPEGLDEVFAWPLHAQAARRWFQAQGITGPHCYERA